MGVGIWKTVLGEEGDKKRWNQEGREGDNGAGGRFTGKCTKRPDQKQD